LNAKAALFANWIPFISRKGDSIANIDFWNNKLMPAGMKTLSGQTEKRFSGFLFLTFAHSIRRIQLWALGAKDMASIF